MPFLPKLRERRVHVDRVPQDDDIEGQAQSAKLILLPFTIALPQLAALPVEDLTGHAVAAFASVELPERRTAATFVIDVRQDMQRLLDPTELRQCLRQSRRSIADLEHAHDTSRRNPAQFERSRQAQKIVPMRGNPLIRHQKNLKSMKKLAGM